MFLVSVLRSAMSHGRLAHPPRSGKMGEVHSLLVAHSMKNICASYFFSCCNSIFLIDIINLSSVRKKTHHWLPMLSDFRKKRRAMGCINKAKRRNSGKKSGRITVNSRLLQKMGLGKRGKSHYEMVCPGVMPSRKIKNRYQCTDCHMCQELFMLSFPPILIAIL